MADYEHRRERYRQLLRELAEEHRLSPLPICELHMRMHQIYLRVFPPKPHIIVDNDAVKKQ